MGKPYNIQELRYSAEASFTENINDLASNTYTARLPCISAPSLSLTQGRIANTTQQNRSTLMSPSYLGKREAEVSFTTHWPGHMSSTASGSLTANWCHALLALGLGGENTGDTGTDIDDVAGTSTTSTIYTTANPGDFQVGSVVVVGAEGDGRAEGHATVVNTVSTQTTTILAALPGAPTDTDVIYASTQIYPLANYDIGTSNSIRMIASMLDTGNQYHLLGGQLASVKFNVTVGELPTIDWTYRFAWWERAADTTPSSVALSDDLSAPWSGADVFFQTKGTSTRNTLNVASMSLELDLPLIAHETTGGSKDYQTVTGWSRGKVGCALDITLQDWSTTYDTLFDSDGSTSTYKHILAQSCRTDGRRTGFYLPKAFIDGNRPTVQDVNGVTGLSFRMTATEDSDASGDLGKSLIRFFFA